MSIKLMQKVFEQQKLESTQKLIMLALADNANDEGFCYPSIRTLCQKTSLSNRTIIDHIRFLEVHGFLLTKKRNAQHGGRLSTLYVLFPHEFLATLDPQLKERFGLDKKSQSEEATPPLQSEDFTPQNATQSEVASPKPSLFLFNHQLFNKLNNKEKELYLEYINLRKKMKLKTTIQIHERLLQKYFDYGRDPQIIQNAIMANWKDFYRQKKPSTSLASKNRQTLKSYQQTYQTQEYIECEVEDGRN